MVPLTAPGFTAPGPRGPGDPRPPTRGQARAAPAPWSSAVGWVFAVNGFLVLSLFSRMPALRDALDVTTGRLGILLLAGSVGSLVAPPFAGLVVRRVRASGAVRIGAAVVGSAVLVISLVPTSAAVFVVGLFAFGVGNGTWEVAMNLEAARVEQRLNEQIMSRFHAAFSCGTAVGAGAAAGAALLTVPLGAHLGVVVLLALAVVHRGTDQFSSDDDAPVAVGGSRPRRTVFAAWREPGTLLLGVLALSAALAESSADDWITIAVVDDYRASHAAGAACLGVFVAAMTVGRYTGPRALARFGQVRTIRVGGVLVLAGLLVLLAGAQLGGRQPVAALVLAATATALWGYGASMGVPVAISAAAAEQVEAPARVSVVTTVSSTAFLAGPPLLGWLGDRVGVVPALLTVAVPVLLAMATAGSARPRRPTRRRRP